MEKQSGNDEQVRRNLTEDECFMLMFRCGVPKRYVSATKLDFDKAIWDMSIPLRSGKREGLFLHGLHGRGKSHLAASILRNRLDMIRVDAALESRDIAGLDPEMLWVSATDLLMSIKDCFAQNSETTEGAVINQYTEVPYLFLDDLGAEKTTEWVLQTLYTIVDRRYRDMRHTVITSNLSPKDLAEKIGSRIVSRIVGMCDVVELKGKDRRIG